MTTTQITVTQDDIDRGLQGARKHCPVALALRRVFPQGGILVEGELLSIGSCVWFPSRTVRDFIEDFDEGDKQVEPFAFTLELPEP